MIFRRHIDLLAVVFIATASNSYAQNYVIVPNDTVSQQGMMEDLATLSIQQTNTSSNNIVLKWRKLSEKVPSGWEASVCDNLFCYTSLIDSGTMNKVIPGDYGLLLLHITPHVNYGQAIVKYLVWDQVYPAKKDTLTYILDVKPILDVAKITTANFFNIYPNPANDKINVISELQSQFNYQILDAMGRQIMNGISDLGLTIVKTENLDNGFYQIVMFLTDGSIQTQKIQIQH